MIDYKKYMYLYPPRPENKIVPESIKTYDNGKFIAQPKYNGSCGILFLDGERECILRNRHSAVMTNVNKGFMDFQSIHSGKGWMVVCGELLNKNKLGEDGKPFNQKFIIWDILVYEGQYLVDETTESRLFLLEKLFPCHRSIINQDGNLESYQNICTTGIRGVYKAPTYMNDFEKIYDEVIQTSLYEGLVIKRADAKLGVGFGESNNREWQIKVRRETKNYNF